MSRRVLAVMVSSLLTLSTPVLAQSSAGATATALFKAARQDMKQGNYQAACPKLRESQRLLPAVGTVLNLGVCEEKLGHLATAWQSFTEAVQVLPPGDERVQLAKEQLKALEGRVPKLTIELAANAPPDARVTRRYEDVDLELASASLGIALPVNPGQHHITVTAAGYESKVYQIEIEEGARETLTVNVGLESAEPPAATPTPPPTPVASPVTAEPQDSGPAETQTTPPWGWVSLGVGGAGLIAGMTTAVLARNKRDQADDECPSRQCTDKGLRLVDDGEQLATISYVGWGVGLVGVTVGVVLLLTSGSKSDSASRQSSHWAGANLELFPQGARVGYRGRF